MSETVATARTDSSGRGRAIVLGVCCLSMFVVGLDTTIVNVGLPAIGAGLGTGARGLEWTIDAYTLVFASLLISSGALADRFGRRRVFRIGLTVFGAASLLCALAPTLQLLVAARAFQGVGASMLSPVALAIVVNAIPDPAQRARAIGVWAAVFGVSMAAGPVIGGALLAVSDWRALFWVNVPIILVTLALSVLFVPESRADRPQRLDLPGQALLTVAAGLAVGVLIEGPHAGWTSAWMLAGYAGIVAAGAGFVRVETNRPEPLMDPRLFRSPVFAGAVLGAIAVFVALNAALLANTLYLQQVRGLTPLAAGFAVLPMAVGATVCAPLSGILVGRHGPRLPLTAAGIFLTLGGACLITLDADSSFALLLLAYLALGIGVGFANAPITNTAVGALPAARAGVAGAVTSTARQFGAALGIAIAGGLVAGTAPAGLTSATHPVWLLVAVCGVFLLVIAGAASARSARRP
ncbi:DHA2 family efflux MFS transporter permease subunit [Nocardia yamanashiensis]|uniref:DHA2 family efflux MFS transporter permease subunit n=1 Tax=Nocardia yamanashiensis TaxID=209247 RepID=UPI001E628706|nr:DHA2 family efflux MFS transporter permease subunit [Nocardia yamanashiensis]UGT43024.1 DHA2 family efflux MFS transporter permease subunit [Nocardia yamanashiensis]